MTWREGIKFSSLPKDVQRQVLGKAETSGATSQKSPPRKHPRKTRSKLMRACLCGFEIFRPDGSYPERCDGCGKKFSPVTP